MKGKRRITVFIGATIIEVIVAKYFGLSIDESLKLVLFGNVLVALWADYVYTKK